MKFTYLIFIGVILYVIFGGLLKKKNPQSRQMQSKRPNPQPRQKTLEDIIRELSAGFEQPKPEVPTSIPQKEYVPVGSLEEYVPEETNYRLEDPEDVLTMDEMADHHVHGKGFDEAISVVEEPVQARIEIRDWRQAIIIGEILKRPQY